MGKFKRLGRGIPSNLHKRKRRFSKDMEKTKRCGQMVKNLDIDVVPFLKWMYRDGGISFLFIENITGIGTQTVRRLIRLTDTDPALQICKACPRIAYRDDGYCTLRCYHKDNPKVRKIPKPRSDIIPCVYNLSCGGSVLKTTQHGHCVRCREKLPGRKADRHAKAVEREQMRAEGLLPPVVAKFCDRCNVRVSSNNRTGICRSCQNT